MDIPVHIKEKPFIESQTQKPAKEFSISKGDFYKIKVHTVPVKIKCLEGLLWVTREGDAEDHLLERCQEVSLSPHGLIVIQGLSQGKFRIISQ